MKILQDIPYARYGERVMPLDLYLPADPQGPVPAILCIVGGGWRLKDKSRCVVPGRGIAEYGYAAIAITYRTSTEALAPANVYDCKAAIRWLRANAAQYGIDPNRIGAFGASAGGHLAALLGTTTGRREFEGEGGNPARSSAVQAVCALCAPVDLTRGARPELRQKYPELYECVDAYLGGPTAERLELAQLISPLRYVSKTTAPTLLIHGEVDDIVPVEESQIYYQALQRAGVKSGFRAIAGAKHSLAWQEFGREIMEFFNQTFTHG